MASPDDGHDDYLDSGDEDQHEGAAGSSTLDKTNVFIKYIPTTLTSTGLYTLFSPYGSIVSCKVMVDPVTSNSLGYGFCRFSKPEEAQKAIDAMTGQPLGNKTLLCKLSHGPGYSPHPPTDNLYVKPLLHDTTEENLRSLFLPFGNVIDCKVMVDKATGQSRQIGFVRFERVDDATRALEKMSGLVLVGPAEASANPPKDAPGLPLVIKYAETKPQKVSRRAKLHANQSAAAARRLAALQQHFQQLAVSAVQESGGSSLAKTPPPDRAGDSPPSSDQPSALELIKPSAGLSSSSDSASSSPAGSASSTPKSFTPSAPDFTPSNYLLSQDLALYAASYGLSTVAELAATGGLPAALPYPNLYDHQHQYHTNNHQRRNGGNRRNSSQGVPQPQKQYTKIYRGPKTADVPVEAPVEPAPMVGMVEEPKSDEKDDSIPYVLTDQYGNINFAPTSESAASIIASNQATAESATTAYYTPEATEYPPYEAGEAAQGAYPAYPAGYPNSPRHHRNGGHYNNRRGRGGNWRGQGYQNDGSGGVWYPPLVSADGQPLGSDDLAASLPSVPPQMYRDYNTPYYANSPPPLFNTNAAGYQGQASGAPSGGPNPRARRGGRGGGGAHYNQTNQAPHFNLTSQAHQYSRGGRQNRGGGGDHGGAPHRGQGHSHEGGHQGRGGRRGASSEETQQGGLAVQQRSPPPTTHDGEASAKGQQSPPPAADNQTISWARIAAAGAHK